MRSKTLAFLLLSFPFTMINAAEVCETYKIVFKNPATEPAKYSVCANHKTTRVQSMKCSSKKSCDVEKALAKLLKKEPDLRYKLLPNGSQSQSPGYLLCEKMKLKPRPAELKRNELGFKTWVCFAQSDRSFIDFGTLLEKVGFGIKPHK